MKVHMVRLYIEPPKGEGESAVDNWVQNHTGWTKDPTDHTLTERTPGIDGDGTTYVGGDYRFIQEETVGELLDDLVGRLESFQGGLWYRLGYHVCTHDGDPKRKSVGEQWTAKTGTAVPVTHNRLVRDSVTLYDNGDEVSGYEVDPAYGEITATADGDLVDGQTYAVQYEHWTSGGPCYWDGPNSQIRENGAVPDDIPTI